MIPEKSISRPNEKLRLALNQIDKLGDPLFMNVYIMILDSISRFPNYLSAKVTENICLFN